MSLDWDNPQSNDPSYLADLCGRLTAIYQDLVEWDRSIPSPGNKFDWGWNGAWQYSSQNTHRLTTIPAALYPPDLTHTPFALSTLTGLHNAILRIFDSPFLRLAVFPPDECPVRVAGEKNPAGGSGAYFDNRPELFSTPLVRPDRALRIVLDALGIAPFLVPQPWVADNNAWLRQSHQITQHIETLFSGGMPTSPCQTFRDPIASELTLTAFDLSHDWFQINALSLPITCIHAPTEVDAVNNPYWKYIGYGTVDRRVRLSSDPEEWSDWERTEAPILIAQNKVTAEPAVVLGGVFTGGTDFGSWAAYRSPRAGFKGPYFYFDPVHLE